MRKTTRKLLLFLSMAWLSSCYSGYHVEGDQVAFYQFDQKTKYFKPVDLKSFRILMYKNEQSIYAKDNKFVYAQGEILQGATPNQFEIINLISGKDSENVFLWTKTMEGANPKSFLFLDPELNYSKDDTHVFIQGKQFAVKDIGTFHLNQKAFQEAYPLLLSKEQKYSFDKDSGYFFDGLNLIPMDPIKEASFRLYPDTEKGKISNNWATDGDSFFCLGRKVPTPDKSHFVILNPFYSKDSGKYYSMNEPMDFVDEKTFELSSTAINAQDKFGKIMSGKRN